METEDENQQISNSFSGEEEEVDIMNLQIPTTVSAVASEASDSDSIEIKQSKKEKKKKRPGEQGTPNAKRVKRPATETRTVPSEAYDPSISMEQAKKNLGLFQKLWSDNDEVAVLQGLIDYNGEKGKSPFEDMNGFYGFIVKSISSEFRSLNQVSTKIKRLKNKYFGKFERKNKSLFSSAHDLKCFELSNSIWGPDRLVVPKSNVKPTRVSERKKKLEEEANWFEKTFLAASFASLGVDEESVKRRWRNVPMEMKKKLQEKWRLLDVGEFKIVSQKSAFLHEVASAMADGVT